MNNYESAVLVSYAWSGESEHTVDELESAFAAHGIRIVRDKKDLGYKGSIEAFEQRISQGQYIILVISDKYLRSEHCMYELAEADKNRNLRDRIFPIVLADADIYKPAGQLKYIKHWEEQIEQLDQAMRGLRVMTNLSDIPADLDKYANIRASVAHLTDLLRDMNALTPEMHAANGFSTLIGAVECAMTGKLPESSLAHPPQNMDSSKDAKTPKDTEVIMDPTQWTAFMRTLVQNHTGEMFAVTRGSIFSHAYDYLYERYDIMLEKIKAGVITKAWYVISLRQMQHLVEEGQWTDSRYVGRLESLKSILSLESDKEIDPCCVRIVITEQCFTHAFQLFIPSDGIIENGFLVLYYEEEDGQYGPGVCIRNNPELVKFYYDYFKRWYYSLEGKMIQNQIAKHKDHKDTGEMERSRLLRQELLDVIEEQLAHRSKS